MNIPPSLLGNTPYPGLRPFRSDETGIFFGREAQVDALLEKLDHFRFLAVIGPSGCGKSSLVRAGMIPALETGLLARAGVRWRVATMRPGERPLRRLAEALFAASGLSLEQDPEAVAFLHATLRRGPRGLVEVLRDTPLPEGTNLLLLVDQFEEIFRYRQQGDSDEADAFVALLLATAAQHEVPVYVVMTMRSDFLGDCAVFHGLPEAINAGQFLTPRLTREQRREAIVGPAMVFGGQVEPALVNRLLNDTGEELDQLPLLQHVLMRMWTRAYEAVQVQHDTSYQAEALSDVADPAAGVTLTLDDYEQVGGLTQALSNHADEAYETLDAEQQRIAAVLFRCLSERSPTQRDTRRPIQLGAVAAVAGVPPAQVAAVADVFRHPDRSFITPSADVALHPDTVLDISHESLIRQWQRLNAWAEQEAEAAETYRRLAQTARLWKRGQAALWSTPDLENALAWKERERPTSAWAARYGQDFALAMEFLDASENQRLEEQQREEAARQSKLHQVRRQLALALVGLCIAVGLAFWAMRERQRAGEARNVPSKRWETTQAREEPSGREHTLNVRHRRRRVHAARLKSVREKPRVPGRRPNSTAVPLLCRCSWLRRCGGRMNVGRCWRVKPISSTSTGRGVHCRRSMRPCELCLTRGISATRCTFPPLPDSSVQPINRSLLSLTATAPCNCGIFVSSMPRPLFCVALRICNLSSHHLSTLMARPWPRSIMIPPSWVRTAPAVRYCYGICASPRLPLPSWVTTRSGLYQ